MNTSQTFTLRGEHITLEALLKAAGLVGGGNVRALIAEGGVVVNEQSETRRGRKLRAGDIVSVGTQRVQVRGA